MKKVLLLAVALCMAVFTSCNKTDDTHTGDSTGNLYGIWTLITKTIESTASDGTVTTSTADYTEDGSFNSYNGLIVSDAAAQIDTFTGKNYSEYEYNCILVPEGAEFCISVTLVKKAE